MPTLGSANTRPKFHFGPASDGHPSETSVRTAFLVRTSQGFRRVLDGLRTGTRILPYSTHCCAGEPRCLVPVSPRGVAVAVCVTNHEPPTWSNLTDRAPDPHGQGDTPSVPRFLESSAVRPSRFPLHHLDCFKTCRRLGVCARCFPNPPPGDIKDIQFAFDIIDLPRQVTTSNG